MDEFNIENEAKLLDSLENISTFVEHNSREFVNDVKHIFTANDFKPEFLKEETNEGRTHISFATSSASSVDISKENVKAAESRREELSVQIELLTKEKEAALEEVQRLNDQLLSQSTYCASLGAVLSNLTWRASRFPQIVDIWLSMFQSKIGEFLSIVNGSFGAFVDTYKIAFPPTSNVEYQFAIGLLGIVTNISASPEGREFLITNSNGVEFVQKIIKMTPELPLVSGSSPFKKLILMILYNVSMNKTGLQYLLDWRIGDILIHCLEDKSSSEEIQLLCLRILQSVTYDLTEPKYIQDLITSIPTERIENMLSSKRHDVNDAAKQVIKYLRDCQKIAK